jgi:hypothetical protein
MECPRCQFENQESMKFCGECGHNFGVARAVLEVDFLINAPADPTICSNCMASLEYPNFMFSKDNPGWDLKGMEIGCGEGARPKGDSDTIVLFGD